MQAMTGIAIIPYGSYGSIFADLATVAEIVPNRYSYLTALNFDARAP
jgi:hypothetical protein